VFFGSREFGGFLQRVTMVWVSSLHLYSNSVELMELQSTFPLFYRTYLIEKWYYN
jgi:hypothetical protein